MSLDYCLYNAIKTPDGTILWCKSGHDYQTHEDKVSGESYMNDGLGYMVRRSVNKVPYEDLSIRASDPFEVVRTAKFWSSYGKDGKSPKVILSLEQIEDDHIKVILETQNQIRGTVLEKLFKQEQDYRKMLLAQEIDEKLPKKQVKNKRPKV